ncbi:MAG: DUF4112 domain-containing protein [Alphaproteobacteria bacterium]|nr:DUF4112 domain-containing protein [Alphaproteobacteria bacterium]
MDPRRKARLEGLANLLDTAFAIPGTKMRFGLDGLLGLIPGVGDTATALLGAWMITEAVRLGADRGVVARMLLNLGIDWAAGSVPLAGDLFDFAFKAHRRNARLLIDHLEEREEAGRRTPLTPDL